MIFWAAFKSISLTYLLGLFTLTFAAIFWTIVRKRIAVPQRAEIGFWLITGTALMTLVFSVTILWGVISYRIAMTTDLFHALMHGGWAALITGVGLVVLVLSLILAYISYLRSRIPPWDKRGSITYEEREIHLVPGIHTAAVVGVGSPQIWANPEYWDSLDGAERSLAVAHELAHIARKDNLKKLLLQYLAAVYALFPWIHKLPSWYELDSELAVDDHCRSAPNEEPYRWLVAKAAGRVLSLDKAAVHCSLSHSDMIHRLRVLNMPRQPAQPLIKWGLVVAGIAICSTPAFALLLYPETRCLLACYLGY